MLHVVLWKWTPGPGVERHYTARHVNHLAHALRANTSLRDMRIICVTDDPHGITQCETHPLWQDCDRLRNASGAHLPSCYRRLKLYDANTQREMGMFKGDRVASLDLDTLVCGPLDAIWQTKGKYVGWLLPGLLHKDVYNGSFQMFTAGELRRVWEDFHPDVSPAMVNALGYRGSDQAWLSYQLVDKEGSASVGYPTVASYPLHIRRMSLFDRRTRLVMFHGKRKPWQPEAVAEAGWIRRYWREEHALL